MTQDWFLPKNMPKKHRLLAIQCYERVGKVIENTDELRTPQGYLKAVALIQNVLIENIKY